MKIFILGRGTGTPLGGPHGYFVIRCVKGGRIFSFRHQYKTRSHEHFVSSRMCLKTVMCCAFIFMEGVNIVVLASLCISSKGNICVFQT